MTEFIKDEVEFDALLVSSNVLVIDCTATWCGPCKLVAPLIENLAEEYIDRAQVFKLDIDANKAVVKRLGIRSIPAIILFKAGEKVETMVGVKSYEEFSLAIANLLK
jgi:thioredoxin 1